LKRRYPSRVSSLLKIDFYQALQTEENYLWRGKTIGTFKKSGNFAIMKKKIRFSLVYRDMWQSSGKYQPRVDQLAAVAPHIVDMGCFDRIETNGGAFEQVQLLFGENPNKAVREWTKPFNSAGIQTHMLERALNGIRMYPVPADVRKLMYKVKKAQGVDIARSFCGLNDHRNLELSVRYAREAGMISQAALSITSSPVHTVDYYMGVVDRVVEYGADEICLKDMAGVGRPASLGELVKKIKSRYPGLIVQYHGHSGPGMSVASMLEVARAGADYLDVAMEPLSWGMVHPDIIAIHAVMKDAGFDVPEINMDAYMKVRSLTQEFIDDFLGFFIDARNRQMTSLLIGSGLPGGMMGSMMADLKGVHQGINAALKAKNKPELSEDELVVWLFREVEHIWPMMGYPPLVTPFSQYVKNVALMNIVSQVNGKDRFSMIDPNTWDMLLGRAGKLPGPLAPELIQLAKNEGLEFYEGNPQDNYPDALDGYRKEMEDNGWSPGEDDEELFELAMHDRQYRDYRSGVAAKRFIKEIEERKSALAVSAPVKATNKKLLAAHEDGIAFIYSGTTGTYSSEEEPLKAGKEVSKGEIVMYILSGRTFSEVVSDRDAVINRLVIRNGDKVSKGDPLIEFR
jgi:pyruvate carboxylase subunit B